MPWYTDLEQLIQETAPQIGIWIRPHKSCERTPPPLGVVVARSDRCNRPASVCVPKAEPLDVLSDNVRLEVLPPSQDGSTFLRRNDTGEEQ
jgi:hypothetical protein